MFLIQIVVRLDYENKRKVTMYFCRIKYAVDLNLELMI